MKTNQTTTDNTQRNNNNRDEQQQQDGQQQTKHHTQTDRVNEETNSDGSMSQGNLSNSRYGRERTQALHEKTGVMGSDTDGQAS